MRLLFGICCGLLFFSCAKESSKLKTGAWRATMQLQDNQKLPFNVQVKADDFMVFTNAEEEVAVNDISFKDDSITINHPIFEGVFKGVFSADRITGDFIKPSLDRVVPFTMVYGNNKRFLDTQVPSKAIEGTWEMIFSPNDSIESYIAKGIFFQQGGKITANIQTTTGDYRYLEGVLANDSLKLSTFDGAHAFLFTAKTTDSTMQGTFYSGNHFKEPFIAKRNATYELPDADSLTFLKDGYERFSFSFPDSDGKQVSLDDPIFKDKVTVVQIMGTWCPNCLDESKYFKSYLAESAPDDVQFVALAFEYAPTKETAFASIARLKERLELPYPILLAQFGSSDKAMANEKLPMLNHILSYPTTIVIDKKGDIQKIHTGFNGPATGIKYEQFKADFESLLARLAAQ